MPPFEDELDDDELLLEEELLDEELLDEELEVDTLLQSPAESPLPLILR